MKTLKLNLIVLLGLLLITACNNDVDEDFDTVAEIHDEAGMLISVSATSNSSILGSPEPGVDLADAEVTITNAYLNMTVRLTDGSLDQIAKVEIVKSFNGSPEVVLGSSTTLPFNLVVDNLDDLLSGTGAVESSLRIGDVLSIRTRVVQTDGDVYYYNSSMGNYSLTINCSSDLAGSYSNPRVPTCTGTTPNNVTVTEVSPGRYLVSSMTQYSWTSGGCIFFYMVDVCGQLTYDGGALEDNGYSGAGGTGVVNSDGSFTFTCFLDATGYSETTTFTPN